MDGPKPHRLLEISRGEKVKARRVPAIGMKREDSFREHFGFRADRM